MVRIHWGALISRREQNRADLTDCAIDVADYERRINPNHAITGAHERRITARVSALMLAVIRAIDLDDEALRGCIEVCDEATEQRHLATNDDAQAAPTIALP